MAYLQGKDVKVYITTESQAGLMCVNFEATTGTYSIAVYDAAKTVVRARTVPFVATTSTSVNGITGIDLGAERLFEDIDLFGQQQQEHIPYNKKYTCKITLKADDNINGIAGANWAQLADQASHCMDGAFGINLGLTPLNETYNVADTAYIGGYRVYVRVGTATNGTDFLWYTFPIAILKHKITVDMKTHNEELSFEGNQYVVSYGTVPYPTDITTL